MSSFLDKNFMGSVKLFFSIVIILPLLSALCYAAPNVSLDSPNNNAWDSDGSVIFNCTF